MNKTEIEVARLDGFLFGTTLFSGRVRDYSANSYLIKLGEFSSVESSLINFFSDQAKLVISNVKYLKNGVGELEREIENYIIRDTYNVNRDNLTSLRKYLSFRIMDLIDDILDRNWNVDVLKMDGIFDSSESISIFFCIQMKDAIFVLQFNDDIEFMKQQEQRYIQEMKQIEEQNRAM